jgi:tRNA threonylcarbamoyladenosine biosynthesis protein TsaB
VAGVCTLDAIGRALQERPGPPTRLAVLDARRGEAFAALYDAVGKRLWDPLVDSPEGLAERIGELPEPPLAAGSGALRFRQKLTSRGVEVPDEDDPAHRVAARHICALAATRGAGDSEAVVPIYLRPPDAERWRERDSLQKAG